MGAADAPDRLPIKFHYSGFWDSLQSCFWGLGPLSACQHRKRSAVFAAALVGDYFVINLDVWEVVNWYIVNQIVPTLLKETVFLI